MTGGHRTPPARHEDGVHAVATTELENPPRLKVRPVEEIHQRTHRALALPLERPEELSLPGGVDRLPAQRLALQGAQQRLGGFGTGSRGGSRGGPSPSPTAPRAHRGSRRALPDTKRRRRGSEPSSPGRTPGDGRRAPRGGRPGRSPRRPGLRDRRPAEPPPPSSAARRRPSRSRLRESSASPSSE